VATDGYLELDEDDGIVVLVGEFDLDNATAISSYLATVDGSVVLDMRETTFIDSTALSAILLARRRGTNVTVRDASLAVRRTFQIAGVADLLLATAPQPDTAPPTST